MMQRRPRVKDEKYLTFIRSLPCLLCGDNTSVEAAHVRMADPLVDKRQTGKGEKPDDRPWTLPLCELHHHDQHSWGEKKFWNWCSFDPLRVCLALQMAYRDEDREAAERILAAHEHLHNFAPELKS